MKARGGVPAVGRPRMPKDYGIPKDKKGLLPWSHVSERMTQAKHYWICTVTPDGKPHATPVDGLWLKDALYFGGSPQTRWYRNLAANPAINVHLENPLEVVILRGQARTLTKPGRALATSLSKASKEKYGFAPKPEDYEKGGVYVFQPRVVIAWKKFPKDATRWQFEER
jgi:nitroimidazol reductase NimA-like FMN-containing flavoprotein (pyridoxamine 5'-phosphate oxidase superfamily)